MKLESLVIVNQDVTVNDISNFVHTAHHAQRVRSSLSFAIFRIENFQDVVILLTTQVKRKKVCDTGFSNSSEVVTR